MGFSNEDNCCQLQGIGKLIKEKLLNRFSHVYCKHRLGTNDELFFQVECFLELFFFPKSCLKAGGAAYTQVRLIHESLRYSFSYFIAYNSSVLL